MMVDDPELAVFVEKLGLFRAALSSSEQRLFDSVLLAAAEAEEREVQGYAVSGATRERVALPAVLALGIVGNPRDAAGLKS
jgi:hypothetical protein